MAEPGRRVLGCRHRGRRQRRRAARRARLSHVLLRGLPQRPRRQPHRSGVPSSGASAGMRIFLAGATGAIGRRVALLLRQAGHEVTGTTRTADKSPRLRELGVTPAVVDVFDADALAEAVAVARPEIVIHQLTDLTSAPGTPGYPAAQEANRRIRIEGTRNLMRAAQR